VSRKVRIDALPESACRHFDADAIVCIDVLLSSTTVVTALALGREAFTARTLQEALAVGRRLHGPLLAHELGSGPPAPFDGGVGPAALSARADVERPLVLVSALSQLLVNASPIPAVYVACLRNLSATAEVLAARHDQVALLGAGHGSEVRFEDQLAAAWIARQLVEHGFEPADLGTAAEMERWSAADISLVSWGKSAEELRRAGRQEEIDFVLKTVDDLEIVARYGGGQILADARKEVAARDVRPSPRVAASRIDDRGRFRKRPPLANELTG
jgi:phosphosulfolactate phosphohydrolase-like enzyme